jgi:hypothetical protein
MAEREDDKGFVVKDRRRFSEDAGGEEPKAAAGESGAPAQETEAGKAPESETGEAADRTQGKGPFPEVSMATFIISLSSSALVHLGEIPEPETNRTQVDLGIAKQIIDTLGMLQEKTKGNLDQDEDRLLRSVLYDLRMRYVEKSSK